MLAAGSERELAVIAQRRAEMEQEYTRLVAGGQDTTALETEAQRLLDFEQRVLADAHGSVRATVACCICGVPTEANETRKCLQCLSEQINLCEQVVDTAAVIYCRACDRYENKPRWLKCEWESKELLALCLRHLKKPKEVRLVDAKFLYTEAHSQRIKLLCSFEAEIGTDGALGPSAAGAIATFRQEKEITYTVLGRQCEMCTKSLTPHVWISNVQIRQRCREKRTLRLLEQVILKYQAHAQASNVVDVPDGLDFHFLKPQDAQSFMAFIKQQFSCKTHPVQCQLISHDSKNNTYNYKYVTLIELAPVNKQDLLFLNTGVRNELGGVAPFMLCLNVVQGLKFLDPFTLRVAEVSAEVFHKLCLKRTKGASAGSAIAQLACHNQMVEFMVMQKRPLTLDDLQTAGMPNRHLAGMIARRVLDQTPVKGSSESLVGSCDASVTQGSVKSVVAGMKGIKNAWGKPSLNQLAEVELRKLSDLGTNERTSITVTHLGGLLKEGDVVLGYDLSTLNLPDLSDELTKAIESVRFDVILVTKQSTRKRRAWEFQTFKIPDAKRGTDQISKLEKELAEKDMEDLTEQIAAL